MELWSTGMIPMVLLNYDEETHLLLNNAVEWQNLCDYLNLSIWMMVLGISQYSGIFLYILSGILHKMCHIKDNFKTNIFHYEFIILHNTNWKLCYI